MNNILILPDTHGRSFWKTPCKDWEGTIVFLGDYHDPYEGISREPTRAQSLRNLEELVEFVTKRRQDPNVGSTICLLGNHDWQYLGGIGECRYDFNNASKISELLKKLGLQIIYEVTDLTSANKFLFSHAGVTQDWLNYYHLELNNLYSSYEEIGHRLSDVPESRGGNAKYGSCIWNSVEDYHFENHIPDYYQIFGHTWGGRTEPLIEQDYAMLDCAKAFVLNTETKEIVPWTSA